ncbi:MAG: GNAT family N-acetyltransferase [Candidatus Thorarchaeota archaeon]
MEINLFKIKHYDDSVPLSKIVDLFNQMVKYFNPETTFQLTEELIHVVLGAETISSRDYLVAEDKQGEIVAFIGISKIPFVKDALMTVYGILPEYIESELPGKLIDALLNLKQELNIPEIIFQTAGELSAPFDKKLESLGFKPVNYTWSMRLDNFNLFSNPGIPEGITIQIQKEIDDYTSFVNVLNKAFEGSFKFEPVTEKIWQDIQEAFKQNREVEYCIAYDKDKIVGLCSVHINPNQNHIGLIEDLGVLPNYHHRKIGRAILASGIETLRKRECTIINLSVDTENEKALGLYKKTGFYIRENFTQRIYQII